VIYGSWVAIRMDSRDCRNDGGGTVLSKKKRVAIKRRLGEVE